MDNLSDDFNDGGDKEGTNETASEYSDDMQDLMRG